MKNILLWSRTTDRKILLAAGVLCALALALAVGLALPAPEGCDAVRLLNGFIAAMLLVLVWASFRLARPCRYSHKWVVAEAWVVPVAWALLVAALGFWCFHSQRSLEIKLEEIFGQLRKVIL